MQPLIRTFGFRITEADLHALEQLAEMHDRKPGEMLRHLIRVNARQAGVMPVVNGEVSTVRTEAARTQFTG